MSTHAVYNHWYDEENETLKVEMRHPGTFGKHVIREYHRFPIEKYAQWQNSDNETLEYFFTFIDEHVAEYAVPEEPDGDDHASA